MGLCNSSETDICQSLLGVFDFKPISLLMFAGDLNLRSARELHERVQGDPEGDAAGGGFHQQSRVHLSRPLPAQRGAAHAPRWRRDAQVISASVFLRRAASLLLFGISSNNSVYCVTPKQMCCSCLGKIEGQRGKIFTLHGTTYMAVMAQNFKTKDAFYSFVARQIYNGSSNDWKIPCGFATYVCCSSVCF